MPRNRMRAKRRAYRNRCTSQQRRCRYAAAALIAATAGMNMTSKAQAAFAGPQWQEGNGAGNYDLTSDLPLDIDGDGITDLTIAGDCLGCGYGEAVRITPEQVGEYNNQIMTGYGVYRFDTADDVYLAVDGGTANLSTYTESIWDTASGINEFTTRGFAGLVFDILGGSEYVGYLDVTIETNGDEFSELVIHETGYAALGGGLIGDLNEDGFVGIGDLNIVLGVWNQNAPPADVRADPSGDGYVGIEDLNVVLGNWNAGGLPTSYVPEPVVAVWFGLYGLMWTRERPIVRR